MKKIYVILAFLSQNSFAGIPARLVDGKVQFAAAEVNGMICWTLKQRDDAVAGVSATTGTLSVIDYIPTNFEVTLTTSGFKFKNYSDFQLARDDKDYLQDKVDDMPPSDLRKNKLQIDYIKSENAKR